MFNESLAAEFRRLRAENARLRGAIIANADLIDPDKWDGDYIVDHRIVAENLRRALKSE